VVEEYHDDYGMILPITVAPYEVHLVSLEGKKSQAEEVRKFSETLYQDLQEAGLEVLYDDRDESPGVKFNDADLIGCPVRLTVGSRSLEKGGVELKLRDQQERELIPAGEITAHVKKIVSGLYRELNENLEQVELKE